MCVCVCVCVCKAGQVQLPVRSRGKKMCVCVVHLCPLLLSLSVDLCGIVSLLVVNLCGIVSLLVVDLCGIVSLLVVDLCGIVSLLVDPCRIDERISSAKKIKCHVKTCCGFGKQTKQTGRHPLCNLLRLKSRLSDCTSDHLTIAYRVCFDWMFSECSQ